MATRSVAPTASPAHAWYYDMSHEVQQSSSCDFVQGNLPPLSKQLLHVGDGKGERAAALVRLVSYGRPRWNTPSGSRPTQRQTETMVVDPGIYTPVRMRIERVLAGSLEGSTAVGYVRAGEIGLDKFSYCVFTNSKPPFTLWDEHTPAVIGGRYLVFFGPELTSGSKSGPLRRPQIVAFLIVRGNLFFQEGQPPRPLNE